VTFWTTRLIAPVGLGQSGFRFNFNDENRPRSCPNITSSTGRYSSGIPNTDDGATMCSAYEPFAGAPAPATTIRVRTKCLRPISCN